jgi:hypothetical protein
MKENKRTTISLPSEDRDLLAHLAEKYGWSVGGAATIAIRTLSGLLDLHERIAGAVEADVGELYRRLAPQVPLELVEVAPKETMNLGWTNPKREQPAILLDNWFITADSNGELRILDRETEQPGRIVDGKIVLVKVPSPDRFVAAVK